ncbi:hypothetical protein GINT2_001490 [Glugoides intestinalis]
MQSIDKTIQEVAEMVLAILDSRFLVNENVFIPSMELSGKIIKYSKTAYTIQTQDQNTIDVPFQEIVRRSTVDFNDIIHFLNCTTKATPFGRIVIENVFEKISQPGFGSRQQNTQNFRKASRSLEQPESDKTAISRCQFDGSQYPSNNNNIEEKIHIDITALERLTLDHFSDQNLERLVKIYSFFSKFCLLTKFRPVSLESLALDMQNPDYNSEVIMKIHKFLVESIEKDIREYGNRFLTELSLLIKELPELKEIQPGQQPKKRVLIVLENWKAQAKAFLHNISIEFDTVDVLRFLDFTGKNMLDLRLEFLEFLLTISYYTETIKSFVHNSQNQAKIESIFNESAEGKEDEKKTEELINRNPIIDNPLRTHIGKYKQFLLFLMDHRIMCKEKHNYYFLHKADAKNILKDLDPYNKAEKNTHVNLKAVIQELERIKEF